jgi:hypothetical protein
MKNTINRNNPDKYNPVSTSFLRRQAYNKAYLTRNERLLFELFVVLHFKFSKVIEGRTEMHHSINDLIRDTYLGKSAIEKAIKGLLDKGLIGKEVRYISDKVRFYKSHFWLCLDLVLQQLSLIFIFDHRDFNLIEKYYQKLHKKEQEKIDKQGKESVEVESLSKAREQPTEKTTDDFLSTDDLKILLNSRSTTELESFFVQIENQYTRPEVFFKEHHWLIDESEREQIAREEIKLNELYFNIKERVAPIAEAVKNCKGVKGELPF